MVKEIITKKMVRVKAKKIARSGLRRPRLGISSSSTESAPVQRSTRVPNLQARMSAYGAAGDITVEKCEFVQTVIGSVALNVLPFTINPGNPILFSWLSTLSTRYEKYRFDRLSFELKSRCPTTVTGTQVLSIDYDASDASPTTMIQARGNRAAVADSPWKALTLSCIREDINDVRFIRTGAALPASTDVKLYDCGNLYVIREGQADTAVISELLVSYRVHLISPQLDGQSGLSQEIGATTGLTANALFGTNNASNGGNLPYSVTTDTFTFKTAGTWTVTGLITGTVLGAGSMTYVGSTAAVVLLSSVTNAGALNTIGIFRITAIPGQTFIPKLASATSVTIAQWFFLPQYL
jgi:hypothetical protein